MKNFLFLFFIVLGTTLNAQVKVIAHRGYWTQKGSAQNSIASLLKADEINAYGSEFDVWRTKEGKLVVNHDKRFKGVNIYSDSFQRIRQIKLDNGEKIPTLTEFLEAAQSKTQLRLILELKSLPTKEEEVLAVKEIAQAIQTYNLLDRTDFIAFSLNACIAFRKELPNANVFYLNGNLTPKEIKDLNLSGIDYSLHALKRHPEWIQQAHQLGLQVNVWTVDKERDMRYFIKKGVDFITTNHPMKLQQLILK